MNLPTSEHDKNVMNEVLQLLFVIDEKGGCPLLTEVDDILIRLAEVSHSPKVDELIDAILDFRRLLTDV